MLYIEPCTFIIVVLDFLAPRCSDGEVRLLRNRVQICRNEVWGYVCYEYSENHNIDYASVVCRDVGLFSKGAAIIIMLSIMYISVYMYIRTFFNAGALLSGSVHIDVPPSFPLFLHEPNCTGSEKHLTQCHDMMYENITTCMLFTTIYCAGKKIRDIS